MSMWSRIGQSFGLLSSQSEQEPSSPSEPSVQDRSNPHVLSKIYEHHPNLSVFRGPDPDADPRQEQPTPNDRRIAFRGISNTPRYEEADTFTFPAQKLISSISSPTTLPQQSSLESHLPPEKNRPSTPPIHDPARYNASARSILRDPNAPRTGQSVRFFHRDAYKVITPEPSTSNDSDPSFGQVLRSSEASTSSFNPALSSMMVPIDGPDESNLFDISQDHLPPSISLAVDGSLQDSAVEVAEDDSESESMHRERSPSYFTADGSLSQAASERKRERSQTPSSDQMTFHSMSASPSPGPTFERRHREDARSPVVANVSPNHRPKDGSSKAAVILVPKRQMDDVGEPSTLVLSAHSAQAYPTPDPDKHDPFRSNANASSTPPPTLIRPYASTQSPTDDAPDQRTEDLIWTMRTKLALHQELSRQYEIDLKARDELVDVLHARLKTEQEDGVKRKEMVRTWKKKVDDLEKACKFLEEEVDRSRQEQEKAEEPAQGSNQVSQADSEALTALRMQVDLLEKARKDVESREETANLERFRAERSMKEKDVEIMRLREELARERQTRDQLVKEAQGSLAGGDTQHPGAHELQTTLANVRDRLSKKEEEMKMLQNELEAQWKNTEQMNDKIAEQDKEKAELREEIKALEQRIEGMEVDWNENENKRGDIEADLQEAWEAKEEAEREKAQIEQQLRTEQTHSDDLTQALQEREDRVTELIQEKQYNLGSISRLEANVRERDAQIEDYSKRLRLRDKENEELHEDLSKLRREHERLLDDRDRSANDIELREGEAKQQMDALVREKAETDFKLKMLSDRVQALTEEIEKQRRRMHELQQESADKDLKIVQMTKQIATDKDDLQGLNIALDSKQQELELLKRKLGVRGTAGSAAAGTSTSKAPSRRESSIFNTPAVPTTASSQSTVKGKERAVPVPTALKRTTSASSAASTTASTPTSSAATPTPKASRAATNTAASKTRGPTLSSVLKRHSKSPSATTSYADPTSTSEARRRNLSTLSDQPRPKSALAAGRTAATPSPAPAKRDERDNSKQTKDGEKSARKVAVPA